MVWTEERAAGRTTLVGSLIWFYTGRQGQAFRWVLVSRHALAFTSYPGFAFGT